MSYPQIIIILKKFKDFFACKIALAANHHYPENIQRLFRLKNSLRRKTSLSWKYSKTFSPEKLSYLQIILILKIFKDFFACKIVLAENHLYPGKIQRLFCLQNCLSRKASLSWKYSKTFSPANVVLGANHHYPEIIQRIFPLKNCLRSKSAISWKHSKTFSPAKLSWPQIIKILEIFKDFFAGKIVLAANLHYPENIQGLFRLQKCLRRNSPLSWNIQRLFRLQICLKSKSSLSWKYSKTFSPANLSYPQIIIILKIFKDFSGCKIVLASNHDYPENIQRLIRLQICLKSKSSLSWKYSKTFSPAKLS